MFAKLDTRLRAFCVASLVVGSGVVGFVVPANAQVNFVGQGIPGADDIFAVCAVGNSINIVGASTCSGANAPATTVTAVEIGTTTLFANGNAVLGAGLTTNGGISVTTGNINIANGDLFAQDVITSGFGSFAGGISVTTSDVTVRMNGNRIQEVGAPQVATDAATKGYVDSENAAQNTQIASQQGQINNIVTVNNAQQTQINSQGERIGSLETQGAQQQLEINELFERDASQQRQIGNLQERDKELAEGIAIALSLDAPTFQPGQDFAMRLGWGNFDGSNAFGATAAGVLDRGSFGANSTVTLDGGVGFGLQQNTVAGKAGLSFGW
jgi:hypothetical protein